MATIDAAGGPLILDRKVVADIAAREGISEAEARERALTTLRLVAARRAEQAAKPSEDRNPDLDDLPDTDRERLQRVAMVRLWLEEHFEPEHRAADIPQRVIDENMADVRVFRRMFHPEVWAICQAILVPTGEDADGLYMVPGTQEGDLDPAKAAAWYAAASDAFAPAVDRVRRLHDASEAHRCELLGRAIGYSRHDFETDAGPVRLRFEQFGFAPSDADRLDAEWVRAVVDGGGGLVGPFETQFGLHVVAVQRIEPSNLPDGELPEKQLRAAREAQMRDAVAERWRASEFQRELEKMRERRVVRVATGVDQEG